MTKDTFIIVRVNHVLVPSVIDYVGHGETPYDLKLRFTPFRASATSYSNKRNAIREAKRLCKVFNHYQFKVVGHMGYNIVFNSRL